jgi:hypothetical protein
LFSSKNAISEFITLSVGFPSKCRLDMTASGIGFGSMTKAGADVEELVRL